MFVLRFVYTHSRAHTQQNQTSQSASHPPIPVHQSRNVLQARAAATHAVYRVQHGRNMNVPILMWLHKTKVPSLHRPLSRSSLIVFFIRFHETSFSVIVPLFFYELFPLLVTLHPSPRTVRFTSSAQHFHEKYVVRSELMLNAAAAVSFFCCRRRHRCFAAVVLPTLFAVFFWLTFILVRVEDFIL